MLAVQYRSKSAGSWWFNYKKMKTTIL